MDGKYSITVSAVESRNKMQKQLKDICSAGCHKWNTLYIHMRKRQIRYLTYLEKSLVHWCMLCKPFLCRPSTISCYMVCHYFPVVYV